MLQCLCSKYNTDALFSNAFMLYAPNANAMLMVYAVNNAFYVCMSKFPSVTLIDGEAQFVPRHSGHRNQGRDGDLKTYGECQYTVVKRQVLLWGPLRICFKVKLIATPESL
jgi:hypothetical protein